MVNPVKVKFLLLPVLVLLAIGGAGYLLRTGQLPAVDPEPVAGPPADRAGVTATADQQVIDISVHTLEELQVVLDRAASVLLAPGAMPENARVVLVLHGPEVEFFSIRNYAQYQAVVDQAARLDALEIVDVKICQAMMQNLGMSREDIPAFIEQVPDGQAEVRRLVRQGYVYF